MPNFIKFSTFARLGGEIATKEERKAKEGRDSGRDSSAGIPATIGSRIIPPTVRRKCSVQKSRFVKTNCKRTSGDSDEAIRFIYSERERERERERESLAEEKKSNSSAFCPRVMPSTAGHTIVHPGSLLRGITPSENFDCSSSSGELQAGIGSELIETKNFNDPLNPSR